MAWSASGRYVFSSRSSRSVQETDIWRTPADGGEPERITHHNGWTASPLSLDERTLLYIASDENNAGTWLYAMDLDTREEHRLSIGIEQYSSISAAASTPGRGRRLVATMSNPAGSLWFVPIGPSVAPEAAASVFPVPSAQVSSPRFGPDYLLYLSSRELADGLWKLQGDASTELWKAREGAVLAAPAVSRDGRQIAISVLRQGRARLFVMTSDGANPQPLAPLLDVREASSWSPDGKTLAVTGYDDKGPGLFLVPLDGGAPVRLYDKLCYLPAWSPDGRYILFAEYVQGPTMQVRAVTSEGQSVGLPVIRFTRPGTRVMSSAYRFLPDGKSLVLLEGEWRTPQFWLVNLETGNRRQLTDLRPGRATRSFDVTPDGKRILFDRVQENADIVLIDLPARQ
jgi:Tol biopolymer transport system component